MLAALRELSDGGQNLRWAVSSPRRPAVVLTAICLIPIGSQGTCPTPGTELPEMAGGARRCAAWKGGPSALPSAASSLLLQSIYQCLQRTALRTTSHSSPPEGRPTCGALFDQQFPSPLH